MKIETDSFCCSLGYPIQNNQYLKLLNVYKVSGLRWCPLWKRWILPCWVKCQKVFWHQTLKWCIHLLKL